MTLNQCLLCYLYNVSYANNPRRNKLWLNVFFNHFPNKIKYSGYRIQDTGDMIKYAKYKIQEIEYAIKEKDTVYRKWVSCKIQYNEDAFFI